MIRQIRGILYVDHTIDPGYFIRRSYDRSGAFYTSIIRQIRGILYVDSHLTKFMHKYFSHLFFCTFTGDSITEGMLFRTTFSFLHRGTAINWSLGHPLGNKFRRGKKAFFTSRFVGNCPKNSLCHQQRSINSYNFSLQARLVFTD